MVIELDFSDCIVDLFGEGYDLVICIGLLVDLLMIVCSIVLVDMVLCCSLDYFVWYFVFVLLVELVGYECLLYGYGLYVEWVFGKLLVLVMVCGCYWVNNGELMCDVVI